MGGRRETGYKDSRNHELEKFSSEQGGMAKTSKEGQGAHRAVELLPMMMIYKDTQFSIFKINSNSCH
jgi:hypothetical protein